MRKRWNTSFPGGDAEIALVLSTGSGRLSQHQWQDRGAPSKSIVDFDVNPVVQVHPKVPDIVGVGS